MNFSQGSMEDLFGSQFDEAGNNLWYEVEDDCIANDRTGYLRGAANLVNFVISFLIMNW